MKCTFSTKMIMNSVFLFVLNARKYAVKKKNTELADNSNWQTRHYFVHT